MKTATCILFFESENDAYQMMVLKNRACKRAGNMNDCYVMMDGPYNNYAVMDIMSAIESGMLYSFSY